MTPEDFAAVEHAIWRKCRRMNIQTARQLLDAVEPLMPEGVQVFAVGVTRSERYVRFGPPDHVSDYEIHWRNEWLEPVRRR